MTVVPNRPQDGNRRPNVRPNGVQDSSVRSSSDGAGSDSQELPPVLFQLPNLNPSESLQGATSPTTGVQATDGQSSNSAPAGDELTQKIDSVGANTNEHLSNPLSDDAAVGQPIQHEAQEIAAPQGRSIVARLASYTMFVAALGMGATWIYVVAKNVRSSSETLTAQATDSIAVGADQLKSSVSLEDTVANAERLAINSNGALPSYSQPTVSRTQSTAGSLAESNGVVPQRSSAGASAITNASSQELLAEVAAAALEVQEAMALQTPGRSAALESSTKVTVATLKPAVESQLDSPANDVRSSSTGGVSSEGGTSPESNSGTKTAKTVSSESGDRFNVTMPAAIVSDQVSATAASTRMPTGSAQSAITPPASKSTVDDTPELPKSNVDSVVTQPGVTATPNALTPPLQSDPAAGATGAELADKESLSSPEKQDASVKDSVVKTPAKKAVENQEPLRRNSKTPTAVSNWLQYLPPAPQK